MDYASTIDSLFAEYDLSTETGRKKAYERCEDYADEHLHSRAEYNAFMQAVGERLQMPPTRRNSLDDELGEVPENAKIHLSYASQNGPELAANADGLRYLASVLMELAEQAVEDDHLHLYPGNEPMYGDTYPLTIYHEPDAWFVKWHSASDEDQQEPAIARRDIRPEEIAALCVLTEVPPDMPLVKHKPYRVLSIEPYDGRDVWKKCIRESDERLLLINVSADDGGSKTFAFDLDDPEVLFFMRQDVARLCPVA